MKTIIRPELFNLNSEINFYNCGEPGNCFHAAMVVFLQLYVGNINEVDFRNAWLCHGVVKLGSSRIVHGWVEGEFLGCGVLVFDASAVDRKMVITTQSLYYRYSGTSDDLIHKYDFGEVMAISELSKHTGIWEPPKAPVIDDLDGTQMIDEDYWAMIRSKRGSLSGEAALRAVVDLRTRLKEMEAMSA